MKRVAFAVPAGVSWPLPLYELTLLTARHAARSERARAEITFVTPERGPLTLFGTSASNLARGLLEDQGVRLALERHPVRFADGNLELAGGETMAVDAVVALPRLRGPSLAGLPHDRDGFLQVDDRGRVTGVPGVFAAGDATAFPVKQGGIATQQADVVAETIALEAGVSVQPTPLDPVLRALLLTGDRPAYVRAALGGQPRRPRGRRLGAALVAAGQSGGHPPRAVPRRPQGPCDRGAAVTVASAADLGGMEAVIFDLDGVVTRTADIHAEAWKQLFDEYLAQRARRLGGPFRGFDRESDYHQYVDGKPRYEGVASFLASRGIRLPLGSPDDPEDRETVSGLGNRKNRCFREALERTGVEPFPTSVNLIEKLRAKGVSTAIASSSRNSKAVLDSAGIRGLFDVEVDGVDLAQLGLPGKPDPALFLEAARRLGVDPRRAAVVEDAISGVEAGRRGHFGLVIGVDRGAGASRARGGRRRSRGRRSGGSGRMSIWVLAYRGFEPASEGLRETLCTLGNGYLATRGAAPEAQADGIHYPGTYATGVLNRLSSTVAGRTFEDESIVNLPNWLPFTFRAEGGCWLAEAELLEQRLELDMRRGVLTRLARIRDRAGCETTVTQRRIVSMDDPHLVALESTLVPENWSGVLQVRSSLDATVRNAGVARYRALAGEHLTAIEADEEDGETVVLRAQTTSSRILVAEAARTRVARNGAALTVERRLLQEPDGVGHELSIGVRAQEPVTIEKVVALTTSRDPALSEPRYAACRAVGKAPGFDELLEKHELAWHVLWRRFGLSLEEGEERTSRIVNLHLFHLLQTLSPHTAALDAGVPARGLHGEAYRGHVFWDELFVIPFITLRLPRLARALLRYRYRRLREARWAAQEAGYLGAMFPWQSGSDGREETPQYHLNPHSGRWNPDNSSLQRHVSAAIAYNVWHYYQVTGDVGFLAGFGAELIIEIARFWSSIASYNRALDRYEICGVMGPDEYHDGRPGASVAGVDNNAYTNVMAVWVLCRALELLELLPSDRSDEIKQRLSVTPGELERWEDVSRKMRLVFHEDGVLSQFEGYEHAGRVRLGGLPLPLRGHQQARPDPGERGRHAESIQGLEAGRRPHAPLPVVDRRAPRDLRSARLRLRRGDDCADGRVLSRPDLERLHPQQGRARLGARTLRPKQILGALPRGPRE